MDHIVSEIARIAEHAAIYRMVGAFLRGHSLPVTLAIGAAVVAVCVLVLRPRRAR
jgi:hypothetical protein